MILTAHQPMYLPWMGLFDKIAKSDVFVSFNMVQFQRDRFINRNLIKTKNGTMLLTIPIKGNKHGTLYDTQIDNNQNWRKKHWRSICQSYSKSRYFSLYAPPLENIYKREWKYIAELNEHLIRWFMGCLDIKTKFLFASDYKFKGKKSDLVLDMCKQLKADTFIFGGHGKNYANVRAFNDAGIKAIFQETHTFSNLSIIDLLFNQGEKSREYFRR